MSAASNNWRNQRQRNGIGVAIIVASSSWRQHQRRNKLKVTANKWRQSAAAATHGIVTK